MTTIAPACCPANALRRRATYAWHREAKVDRLPIDVAALRVGDDFPAVGIVLRSGAAMSA